MEAQEQLAPGVMDQEELSCATAVDDLMDQPDALPEVPPPFTVQQRFTQLFAVDVAGQAGHDMYVYVAPTGLCVVGLAPSHALLCELRNVNAADGKGNGLAAEGSEPQQGAAAASGLQGAQGVTQAFQVSFDIGGRSANTKASGKTRKHGAHLLDHNSVLCMLRVKPQPGAQQGTRCGVAAYAAVRRPG
jgi:hypothetical protein